MIQYIVSTNTSVPYILVHMESGSTIKQLKNTIQHLIETVNSDDIVLCAWAMPYDDCINSMFEVLASHCFVVVAAGNTNEPIEKYTPTCAKNVIVVGALNKSGKKASLSGYSDTRPIEWVIGTNYNVNGKLESGTSISAALYASFLAEAVRERDYGRVQDQITCYHSRVMAEYEIIMKHKVD